MNAWCWFQNTAPWPTTGTYSSVGGLVTACQISNGYSGRGTSVSACTVLPRSGMPGTGIWKNSPW